MAVIIGQGFHAGSTLAMSVQRLACRSVLYVTNQHATLDARMRGRMQGSYLLLLVTPFGPLLLRNREANNELL